LDVLKIVKTRDCFTILLIRKFELSNYDSMSPIMTNIMCCTLLEIHPAFKNIKILQLIFSGVLLSNARLKVACLSVCIWRAYIVAKR